MRILTRNPAKKFVRVGNMYLGLDREQVACAKILLEGISSAKEKNNKDCMITTYKALSDEVKKRYGIYIHHHTEIKNVIGSLVEWCVYKIDEDAPFISVLVGSHDNSGMPGDGYWNLYDKLRGKSVPRKQRLDEYVKEVNDVFAYDWSYISKWVDRIAAAREI